MFVSFIFNVCVFTLIKQNRGGIMFVRSRSSGLLPPTNPSQMIRHIPVTVLVKRLGLRQDPYSSILRT